LDDYNISPGASTNNNLLSGTPSALFAGPFPAAPSSSGNYRLNGSTLAVNAGAANGFYPVDSSGVHNTASPAWIALDDMVTAGTLTASLRNEILAALTNDLTKAGQGTTTEHARFNGAIDLGAYEY
jgi:hypothetical protein